MTHRILILGAGYAGTVAAGTLARRLCRQNVQITLVNDAPEFVERVRLHELAVGREQAFRPLAAIFSRTFVDIRIARVTNLDVTEKRVLLSDGTALQYDSLVVGLGSGSAQPTVEVKAAEIQSVSDREAALNLYGRLSALSVGRRVSVVGGGLTSLESISEIAESYPNLELTLHAGGALGAGVSKRAARHIRATLSRLDVQVLENQRVVSVDGESVGTEDGRSYPADLVVWSTGFTPNPLVAKSDLETHSDGRVRVDRTLRSLSHPDVLAVGDVARTLGPGGKPLRMSCASAIPMGWQAAETLTAEVCGRSASKISFDYYAKCVSLGRNDGVIQPVRTDDTTRQLALTGTAAGLIKEQVCRGAAWAVGYPGLVRSIPSRPMRRRN